MQSFAGTRRALTGGVAQNEVYHTDLSALVRTLTRRARAMIAIFVGFLGLVILLTLLLPSRYTTVVKLIAGNSNGNVGQGADTQIPVLNALLLASGMQTAETYVELFQETPVAAQVIDRLSLHVSPHELLNNVSIKPVTNTSILSLAVTWPDAQTSAKIANAFGDAVVDRERQLIASQANTAIAELQQQMPTAQNSMHTAQARLAEFEATHHLADIGAQTQSIIAELATLDGKVGQAQADQQQARAQLASIQSSLASTPPTINGGTTVAANPVLQQLQTQLSQVEVQLQTALRQYTSAFPVVINLKNQETQLKREIAAQQATVIASTNTVPNPLYQALQQQRAQYETAAAADGAQITSLQQQRRAMNPVLANLPAEATQLADLQGQAKAATDVYNALQQKQSNAAIARDTALSDVVITQPATAQSASKSPNLMFNLILGVVLGAVLSVLGAFVIDYFDNTVKDDREVEEELELAPLGAIPLVRMRNGTPELPWVQTLTVEAFLQLVTSIKYSSDAQLHSLVVTSPSQGDGKSTIALNIALAMSKLEPPVLLIDADLRRPSLHAKLGIRNERGLSDILVGRAQLSDVVQKSRYSGMDILTSGTPAPNPIKLLESTRLDDVLHEAGERYGCVIIDGAALSVNVDSAVIGRKADGTVIVLSASHTDLRNAKKALRRLSQIGVRNILGFVLNRVVPRRQDYDAYQLGFAAVEATEEPMITA